MFFKCQKQEFININKVLKITLSMHKHTKIYKDKYKWKNAEIINSLNLITLRKKKQKRTQNKNEKEIQSGATSFK